MMSAGLAGLLSAFGTLVGFLIGLRCGWLYRIERTSEAVQMKNLGEQAAVEVSNLQHRWDSNTNPEYIPMDEVAQKIKNYAKSKRRNCHQTATEQT